MSKQIVVAHKKNMPQRAPKGTVSVKTDRGRLRLVWSWQGKRYFLALGLHDTRLNRVLAEEKAKSIEKDILLGQFDQTLNRYQPRQPDKTALTGQDLINRFLSKEKGQLSKQAQYKYGAVTKHLLRAFGTKPAIDLTEQDAEKFTNKVGETLLPETVFQYLSILRACWSWAAEVYNFPLNPWNKVIKKVRGHPKRKVDPFDGIEVVKILQGFAHSKSYAFYLDYVRFNFSIGTRLGEAIGLTWEHVSDDCSQVWISQSYSLTAGLKETKTSESRWITVPPDIQKMLLRRKEVRGDESFVFPAKKGGPLNGHWFGAGPWKKVLKQAGVRYRRPYTMRATFISTALTNGMHYLQLAEITGHQPETLLKFYSRNISGNEIPTLFELEEFFETDETE